MTFSLIMIESRWLCTLVRLLLKGPNVASRKPGHDVLSGLLVLICLNAWLSISVTNVVSALILTNGLNSRELSLQNVGRNDCCGSSPLRMMPLLAMLTLLEQRQEIQGILESLQLESGAHMLAEFTDAEIQEALNKGKSGKTSGLTGITYELLVAMWGVEDGRTILRQFLNNLFTASQHPQGLYRAFVLLIPKVAQVGCIVVNSSVSVWGCCRSAFDSLQHVAVARWISESTPSHLAREALQLLRVVLQPQLVFAWKGVQWEVSQAQGVQQGHTYSSGVFSFIIGHLLQQEFQRCRADGFDSVVGDWGWLFIDDLLLHFDDWNTAIKLLPRIQDALSAVGLAFNLTKTQLMASPATLAAGRELVLPAGHVLSKVPWVDLTQYLRKPLRHLRVGENLWHLWQPFFVRSVHHGLQQMLPVLRGLNWLQPNLALTILNRYIGSKWLWASPVVPPTVHALDSIRTLQATALQTLLQLHIPTLLQKPQAMVLHRLRKRAVYLFLNDKIPQTWTFQWQLRFWNYFGHVLRRPPEAPVRAAVSSMIRMRRPQGGFPNSPLDWLLRCAAKAFNAVVSPVEIFALPADRLAWKLRGLVGMDLATLFPGAGAELLQEVWSKESLRIKAASSSPIRQDMQPYIFFFTKMRAQWHVDFSDQVDGSVEALRAMQGPVKLLMRCRGSLPGTSSSLGQASEGKVLPLVPGGVEDDVRFLA
ncbi:unnamed protein product [Symbiodinium natans]|uniref:Reverse transcriptase domain-containing protein n=1 Tax=Symbiodinium natans TaxID=878477 RepID=A0A812HU42_9DINO|nr:unnamed protein product [Symbiodinium natans]